MEVMLFGMIAEKAEASRIEVKVSTVSELRARLAERITGLDRLSYAIAVDRQLVRGDLHLTGGEEIAVLPPFAGG